MDQHSVLACRNVHHWFGEGDDCNRVLHDVNLRVVQGEIVSLVGPSGCGKSTLLRAMVGTHPPRKGRVLIFPEKKKEKQKEIQVGKPSRRIGIVYQHYSLFPFLTARRNVALGLMFDQTSIPFRLFMYLKWRNLAEVQIRAHVRFDTHAGIIVVILPIGRRPAEPPAVGKVSKPHISTPELPGVTPKTPTVVPKTPEELALAQAGVGGEGAIPEAPPNVQTVLSRVSGSGAAEGGVQTVGTTVG